MKKAYVLIAVVFLVIACQKTNYSPVTPKPRVTITAGLYRPVVPYVSGTIRTATPETLITINVQGADIYFPLQYGDWNPRFTVVSSNATQFNHTKWANPLQLLQYGGNQNNPIWCIHAGETGYIILHDAITASDSASYILQTGRFVYSLDPDGYYQDSIMIGSSIQVNI